jgi:hypothetical protein
MLALGLFPQRAVWERGKRKESFGGLRQVGRERLVGSVDWFTVNERLSAVSRSEQKYVVEVFYVAKPLLSEAVLS